PIITVVAPDNTNDTTPTITGKTDAAPGSTVTIVVTDTKGNEQTLTTRVKPDGSYSVDVETPLAEGEYKAEASVTDPAGNTGTDDDLGSVDITAPIISVVAPDNTNDTTPTITGQTDAAPGSTVTIIVTDSAGNSQELTTTVKPDGSYSVDVETPLAEGEYKADASVTDPAGNTATDDDLGSVDTIAPTLSIELQGAGADNIYNQAEIGEDGSVTAKVTLNPGTLVGDLLVVKDGAGTVLFSGAVTEAMLKDGLDVEVPITGGLTDVKVTAQVTDQAGNLSPEAQDTAGLDNIVPPSPNVELQGAGADNIYNQAEIGEDGSVTAKVTLNPGTLVGDKLVVKDGAGTVLFSGTVTEAMLKMALM
ncbi:MAG: Ig-like domain-containing protein, partial [Aeromonas sp.]